MCTPSLQLPLSDTPGLELYTYAPGISGDTSKVVSLLPAGAYEPSFLLCLQKHTQPCAQLRL